jgi:hypothetical protein
MLRTSPTNADHAAQSKRSASTFHGSHVIRLVAFPYSFSMCCPSDKVWVLLGEPVFTLLICDQALGKRR